MSLSKSDSENSSKSSPSVVVAAPPRPSGSPLAGVKHVIAVGSGKGGVGKSTTAVNLALALSKLGAQVGLMDADIYGPSIPKLLGAQGGPQEDPQTGKISPPIAHGIKVMSMALISTPQTPTVWRGPMASRAVSQFLSEIDWGDLDYLIVDLPPGTGDIQLTLAQAARLSGAIIVMTPQGLAQEIAKRGLKMFQQLRIPILGLVENMSEYICPECGHHGHIFRKDGGLGVSKELQVPLLSKIPLDPQLVEDSDNGLSVIATRPDSEVSKAYLELARNMAGELSTLLSGGRSEKPTVVSMEPHAPAKLVKITWSDGKQSAVSFKDLRFYCPCANCVDENSGQRKIKKESIHDSVAPSRIQTVGNYALGIHFSDGHNTGIYSYDYLRRLFVNEGK